MDAEFASLLEVLERTGIDESRVVRFAEPAPTAQLTAEALGTDAAHVVNSLIFSADGEPLLVLASGGHRVSTHKISAALAVRRLRRASPEFVTAHTGQEVGGVGPIGHPRPIRTVIDLSLSTLGTVWVGAGTHDSVFETDFAELVALTRGLPLDIAD
jgi:prolyl-tRNA editing enzyme YbaK/EbsC (Cys-tRNA(Pro) deacylase)